jgi:hypothetical protein
MSVYNPAWTYLAGRLTAGITREKRTLATCRTPPPGSAGQSLAGPGAGQPQPGFRGGQGAGAAERWPAGGTIDQRLMSPMTSPPGRDLDRASPPQRQGPQGRPRPCYCRDSPPWRSGGQRRGLAARRLVSGRSKLTARGAGCPGAPVRRRPGDC